MFNTNSKKSNDIFYHLEHWYSYIGVRFVNKWITVAVNLELGIFSWIKIYVYIYAHIPLYKNMYVCMCLCM